MSVTIRAPRPEDVAPLTEVANLPGVRRGTLRLPFTPESQVRQRLLDPGPNVHPLVAELGGVAVGQGGLMVNTGRQRHSGSIFLFVHDDQWRQGIGRALLGALIDLADNWLGLRRLQLEVRCDNLGAFALYTALGFEQEGRLRGVDICDGQLVDCFVMGRLVPPLPLASEEAS